MEVDPFGAISGVTLLDYYLRLKTSKELRSPVHRKFLQGSKPLYTGDEGRINIPRPDLDKQISTFFLPKPANSGKFTRFGVVRLWQNILRDEVLPQASIGCAIL